MQREVVVIIVIQRDTLLSVAEAESYDILLREESLFKLKLIVHSRIYK